MTCRSSGCLTLIRPRQPSLSSPPPRLFGISNEKNGSSSHDIIMAGKSSFLDKVLGRIARLDAEGGEGVVRHEFEVHFPRPRFLRLYAAPLDGPASGSSGVALIIHDATEARQKTFEAIESERIQALTLLAASVAHESGNPLNALHIHLQLMERELKKLKNADLGPARSRNRPQPPAGENEAA